MSADDFTDLIYLDVLGCTKEEVFMNIALFTKEKELIQDEALVYRRLLDYEKTKGTTVIGRGVVCFEALALNDLTRPSAFILCRTKELIDFNVKDNAKVRVLLVSLSRTIKDVIGLKHAAHLVRFLKSEDCTAKFLKAADIEEVYRLFCEEKGGKDGIAKV